MVKQEIALKYSPILLMDKNEPFQLKEVGYTIMTEEGQSPSFNRRIQFDKNVSKVIEYAYYWNYDIQHLYDLEHIWVYLDNEGRVLNCEGSFHGRYFKVLLKDRSNLGDGCRVMVYCQPGKHAFSAIKELFELHPGFDRCTTSEAGKEGLCDSPICNDRVKLSYKEEMKVKAYMKSCAFEPSGEYKGFYPGCEMMVPWHKLYENIPKYLNEVLENL